MIAKLRKQMVGLLTSICAVLGFGACVALQIAYQSPPICSDLLTTRQNAEKNAATAGIMDWNLYRADYERMDWDRADTLAESRAAYLAGARESYNELAASANCPYW